MVNKKPKKTSKKATKKNLRRTTPRSTRKATPKPLARNPEKPAAIMNVQLSGRSVLSPLVVKESRVFSIEIESISGETTIGDLIVAFPRTRDVLMKHGLRFDVEQAGYLYMTLNVFSAIHGVASNNLIQEIHTASKESLETPAQTLRSIAVPPTS